MEVLPEEVGVFNTQTGEGNPTVLADYKKSTLDKTRIVLSHDRRNGSARRVAKWAVRPDFHDPDFSSL